MADWIGRNSKNGIEEQIQQIEYFKEISEKENLFDNKLQESGPDKTYLIERGVRYSPYIKNKSRVYLMVGLPGSGKDFYIKNNLEYPVISLDDLKKNTVLNMVTKKEQEKSFKKQNLLRRREQLISLFREYGAIVEIVYIEKPFDKVLKQNREREESVPEEYIIKGLSSFDVPLESEADYIRYVVEE